MTREPGEVIRITAVFDKGTKFMDYEHPLDDDFIIHYYGSIVYGFGNNENCTLKVNILYQPAIPPELMKYKDNMAFVSKDGNPVTLTFDFLTEGIELIGFYCLYANSRLDDPTIGDSMLLKFKFPNTK